MRANPNAHSPGPIRRGCAHCGARLRRENPGELCELCSRRGPDIAVRLREAGLFTQAGVRRALALYDFGYLFRAVRRTTELTQAQLGVLLMLDQDRVSRVERGERPLRDIADVARVASRLGIPPVLLGFAADATTVDTETSAAELEEADWVRRRNFSYAAAGILLGLGVTGLDIERLIALLPADRAAAPARIGATDVAAIEYATGVFRSMGFSHGGGLHRPAVVAQLRSVLALQDAVCTEQVQQRLRVASADLGMVAAWASYDAERHNDARQLWLIALSLAAQSQHPQAADLTAHLLMQMTHQALHLRRPEEAFNLIELASHSTTRHHQPLPASTASNLAGYQAWIHAAQQDARACDRALGQTVEHFAHADPTTSAPWAAHLIPAEIAAKQGHAIYTLALSTADPQRAVQAVPLLREAVDGFGSAYARSRALNLAGLAGSQALTGDLDAAASTGHQAVRAVTALALPRADDRLRTLDTVLAHHTKNPAISAVREEIRTALVAA